MSQEAPGKTVMTRVARRLGVLIVLLIGLYAYAGQGDDASRRHRIGTSYLAYDQRAQCVLTKERAIVLDSGMQDGRGVAFTWHEGTPRLYVADAWEGMSSFVVNAKSRVPDFGRRSSTPRTMFAPAPERCPDGQCVEIEYGGLFEHPENKRLVLSDAHRQQLLVLAQPDGGFETSIGGLRGVKDAAWQWGRFYVADSDPDTEDRTGGASTGNVYESDGEARAKMQPIINSLRKPVGIVASAWTNRVYVADLEARSEVWSYYQRVENPKGETRWSKAGTLWRQALGPYRPAIRLQGMALADYDPTLDPQNVDCRPAPGVKSAGATQTSPAPPPQEVIVAAGPDGLYFFHSHGMLLAKYFLGRPVAGVTWGPEYSQGGKTFNWLYFTSGRQIGALKTQLRKQAAVSAPAKPATGSP
jgi:sugar lactone lactonase YvrE